MQKTLFFAFVAVAFFAASTTADPQLFAEFQRTHGKYYASSEEHANRYQIFVNNLNAAHAKNAARQSPDEATYGITQFSDLTPEEFRSQYLMPPGAVAGMVAELAQDTEHHWQPTTNVRRATLPTTFDWRSNSKTVITPVQNQGSCGSCWAFSAAEELESMAALAGYPLNSLSTQQLVACDPNDSGCNGGCKFLLHTLSFSFLLMITSRAYSCLSIHYELWRS